MADPKHGDNNKADSKDSKGGGKHEKPKDTGKK